MSDVVSELFKAAVALSAHPRPEDVDLFVQLGGMVQNLQAPQWELQGLAWIANDGVAQTLVAPFRSGSERVVVLLEPAGSGPSFASTDRVAISYAKQWQTEPATFDSALLDRVVSAATSLPGAPSVEWPDLPPEEADEPVPHEPAGSRTSSAPPQVHSSASAPSHTSAREPAPFVGIDAKVAEYCIQGFTILEDVISHKVLDRIEAEFMPLLAHVRGRDTVEQPEETGDIRTGLGRCQEPNRYTVHWPYRGGLAAPELVANPTIFSFLDSYWDRAKYSIVMLHSNTPYPGAVEQEWHRDLPLMVPWVGLQRGPIVAIRFPLVDIEIENGALELIPGTQYIADPSLEGRYDDIIRNGNFPATHRATVKRGSAYVVDTRVLHRGMPNRGTAPRPDILVGYALPWVGGFLPLHADRNEAERMKPDVRRMIQNPVWI